MYDLSKHRQIKNIIIFVFSTYLLKHISLIYLKYIKGKSYVTIPNKLKGRLCACVHEWAPVPLKKGQNIVSAKMLTMSKII